jgi:hypothetical protein
MDEQQDQRSREEKEQPSSEAQDRAELDKLREEARQRRLDYLESLEEGLSAKAMEWKQTFKNVESIHVLNQLWIYRGLTRGEYLTLMSQGQDKAKNEILICNKCILWPGIDPSLWDAMGAGLTTTLSDLILAASGFGAEDPVPIRL